MNRLTSHKDDNCYINTLLIHASLDDIRTALRTQLSATPEQMHLRWRLFQVLCLLGEWQSALKQLQTCAAFEFISSDSAQAYRQLIQAEQHRAAILAGQRMPRWYQDDCPEWADYFMEALQAAAKGDMGDADMIRTAGIQCVPDMSGTTNLGTFNWITDSDTRLGPVVELVIAGELQLIPFHHIQHMQWQAPKGLLDLVWTPVIVTLSNGTTIESFMPTRYVISKETPDQAKLSRLTEWHVSSETTVTGTGQKVWMTDQGDLNICDLRHLQMTVHDETSS